MSTLAKETTARLDGKAQGITLALLLCKRRLRKFDKFSISCAEVSLLQQQLLNLRNGQLKVIFRKIEVL